MLESFDDHAITYFMRIWTRRVANLTRFRDGVNSRIWYQLKRRNIEVPFPIRTIHMHEAPDMEVHRRSKAQRKASELFSQVDIFRGLESEIVGQLAAASQRRLFDAGETLVNEGDEGDSLFVIERGSVRVTKVDPDQDGKSVDLAVLEEGAFFGEMSLLTGEPRSATVLAREHCGVLMLGKAALASTLEADPRIAEELSRALAFRLQDTSDTLEDRRGKAAAEAGLDDEQTFLAAYPDLLLSDLIRAQSASGIWKILTGCVLPLTVTSPSSWVSKSEDRRLSVNSLIRIWASNSLQSDSIRAPRLTLSPITV